jgi:hypothetical protein
VTGNALIADQVLAVAHEATSVSEFAERADGWQPARRSKLADLLP